MPKIADVTRAFIFVFDLEDEDRADEISVNGVIDEKLTTNDYLSIESYNPNSVSLMLLGSSRTKFQ